MSFQAAEAERRSASMVRVARVVSVDPGKARARVSFGAEAESAELPFMAMRAGAAKVWAPPAVGEQVWVLAESGDTAQGVILGAAFQKGMPAPSSAGEAVEVHLGDAALVMLPDSINLSVGGVSLTISGAGVAVEGGSVTHNGRNIGDDHQHSGVTSGPGTTGEPV
ncbi:phage baseplate assembly protein V [Sulfitobacter sp. OXR-159]|uniref:phage baseplate assembly protein V n=1 Tax=Sulfitobacter sp. OXR-159 TaxID=3100174 RepID=UPI002AC9AF6B|nr:phage baseplate assembly protein V [Sulfitobacter sp. OXR-159]WPZ28971.1 phage baseplate assembly protein V [Sulfitobacter sp. OXR-159]